MLAVVVAKGCHLIAVSLIRFTLLTFSCGPFSCQPIKTLFLRHKFARDLIISGFREFNAVVEEVPEDSDQFEKTLVARQDGKEIDLEGGNAGRGNSEWFAIQATQIEKIGPGGSPRVEQIPLCQQCSAVTVSLKPP